MNLSIGSVWIPEKKACEKIGRRGIEKAVTKADLLMYIEKEKYHQTKK